MSFFNDVYGDRDLSARAKMVCLYLHDRANGEGESWYAIGTIAADLALSRSTVKRALGDLIRPGGEAASLPGERRSDFQPVPIAEVKADKHAASPPRGGCASQLDLGPGHCGPPRRSHGEGTYLQRRTSLSNCSQYQL